MTDPDRQSSRDVLDKIAFLSHSRCPCGGWVTVHPNAEVPYAVTEHTPDCPLLSEVETKTDD